MERLSQNSAAPAEPQRWVNVFWLILTTLGLLILAEAFRAAPCWIAPMIVVLLAYPIWTAQRESFLFKRRVALLGAVHEHSQTRQLLWNGHLGVILHIPLALGFAALLLALSVNLSALHWLVLFTDAVILAVGYGYLRRKVASQVRPEVLGVFVRRWPLWLANLSLLTLAFFILNFFVIGAPDLRQTSWHVVAEQAFASGSQIMSCSWSGWLVGSLSALEQGSWALAQQIIPNLPGYEWRLAAWLLFLLQLSLLSIIFTHLQLGVLSLVEARAIRAESVLGESTFAKTFIVTILVLALPFLYASLRLRDLDPQQLAPATAEVLNWVDPCQHQTTQNAAVQSELNAELVAHQNTATQDSERRIDREVDLLFAPVEAQVDDYLDWYFTVIGEYERLAALATGNFAEMMAQQLEQHLFVSTGFHTQLDKVDQALVSDTLTQMANLSQRTREQIDAQVKASPCVRSAINPELLGDFDRDVWRTLAAGTSGAVIGVATVVVSKKVVAAVVAKVGAKKSVQVAAAVAAKMAAKKGGSVLAGAATGAAICAPSGPVAILCGIGAGVATWIAVDKVAIEIDESVSREKMRAEILDAVIEEKRNLKITLQQRHTSLIAELTQNLQTTLDGVFIPARNGL
jgi:hypothetical protein